MLWLPRIASVRGASHVQEGIDLARGAGLSRNGIPDPSRVVHDDGITMLSVRQGELCLPSPVRILVHGSRGRLPVVEVTHYRDVSRARVIEDQADQTQCVAEAIDDGIPDDRTHGRVADVH